MALLNNLMDTKINNLMWKAHSLGVASITRTYNL